MSKISELRKIKEQLDNGSISFDEYERLKKEINQKSQSVTYHDSSVSKKSNKGTVTVFLIVLVGGLLLYQFNLRHKSNNPEPNNTPQTEQTNEDIKNSSASPLEIPQETSIDATKPKTLQEWKTYIDKEIILKVNDCYKIKKDPSCIDIYQEKMSDGVMLMQMSQDLSPQENNELMKYIQQGIQKTIKDMY